LDQQQFPQQNRHGREDDPGQAGSDGHFTGRLAGFYRGKIVPGGRDAFRGRRDISASPASWKSRCPDERGSQMAVKPAMNTARFTTVVAQAGRPTPHLTWLPLADDATLKAAVAAHRLLTIHQTMRGGKKDFGTVGFSPGRRTQLLIFPKTLRRFAAARVVGIDYALMDNGPQSTTRPKRSGPRLWTPPRPTAQVVVASRPPSEPAPHFPPPKPAPALAAPAEIETLLTWSEALTEIKTLRLLLARKPAQARTRLEALAHRMEARLAPH